MTKIAGRYEITAKLGEGGMGVVFRAHDPAPMDREVAVKTLHEFADPLALELFYKECSALKSISHPNIVEIFDMGEYEEDGHKRPFFVMPLLPGTSLDQLIRRASHRLTVDRVVEIFAQTCRGLQAAHEYGLVHRDIKPSNIFVMADDSVKLIDFGVAHVVHARSRTTGFDKGTLLYMSPEQVQHKPVSVQSDIYSLGVTLYEALTRRQPFRAATEDAVIQAILSTIPPPASDLNPAVTQMISRVVHKAMAKQPWTRFDSAREFGDVLQKAWRNEPIALFDASRTQPRIQTATRALEKGDYQFAGEIVAELEAEGNIEPQISMLRAQIDQVTRQKTVAQLLESARARYEEEEDPLALQKIQEVLQLDPTNVSALALKSKIEDRRSERQIEKWLQLARQHVDNHSFGHAREALQNALALRPKDPRAARLLKEIEAAEDEYVRLRREKTEMYQAAVNAWQNGEVSQALSQMKRVLDLDRQAPDTSSTDAAGAYQSFYNKLRSEHEAINTGYADARRCLSDRQFAKAVQVCQEFLTKYPGHALFQALKFDIEEQQRQQLSAFIADVDRRLEAEPDLNAKVSLIREALTEYPEEDHFTRLARLFEDKRDLVNSIVERARVHESRGQFTEAINDYETLQTIHVGYPGLTFEKERLQKRLQQQSRDAARATWVRQIDAQLAAGDYPRASELLDKAEAEFAEDAEFAELRKLALQGRERATRADELVAEGQELCATGQFEQGVDLLNLALQLDDRTSVRMTLRDLFVARAQDTIATDWRTTETFVERALELDPNHTLARSLRAQALDKKREQEVEQCASQSRRLQASGDIEGAVAEVERGLAAYPAETRLTVIAEALRHDVGRPVPPPLPEAAGPSSASARRSASAKATADRSASRGGTPAAPSSEPVSEPALASSGAAAPPEIERTRLVTDRRAGHTAPAPEVEVVESESIIPRVAPSPEPPSRDPSTTSTKDDRARLPRWALVMAAAVVLAVIGAVILVQRYRSSPSTEPPTEQWSSGAPSNSQGTASSSQGTSSSSEPTSSTASTSSTETQPPAADTTSPADPSSTTSRESTTASSENSSPPPALAAVALRDLPPGTRVTLDDSPIGTVGSDGRLARANIPPGRHTLQFTMKGYDTASVTRDFSAAQPLTLTAADIKLTRTAPVLELQADSGTEIVIAQGGRTIQQVRGPSKIPLPEGMYDLSAKGPAGVVNSTRVAMPAAGTMAVDVRSLIVSGMERFDRAGWTESDSWVTRRGGNYVLYNRTGDEGTISFTVRLDRSGNPFSSGARLNWVVGFADSRNYILLQLDKDSFYRQAVVNSVPHSTTKKDHDVPNNVPYVNLRVQLLGGRLVHEFSTRPNDWRTLDAWATAAVPVTGTRSVLNGQFGFFLPGDEEITISNFLYYPPARPNRTAPAR